MFDHLKAEEFVDLLEGRELPGARRVHGRECSRCRGILQAIQKAHTSMAAFDDNLPEPDWLEFRSNVRDRLLSRSVQRASAVRRWTGWSVRPAFAWSLSMCVAVGITVGLFVWNGREPALPPPTILQESLNPGLIDLTEDETEWAVWSNTGLFDEVQQLESSEQDELRQMLESAEGPGNIK